MSKAYSDYRRRVFGPGFVRQPEPKQPAAIIPLPKQPEPQQPTPPPDPPPARFALAA